MIRKTMIGMCSSDPDEVRILKKYGYDFYEGDFGTITAMPQERYEALLAATRETGLRSLGMNCFAYAPNMLLEMSLEELDEYFESRLPRALELGIPPERYAVPGVCIVCKFWVSETWLPPCGGAGICEAND